MIAPVPAGTVATRTVTSMPTTFSKAQRTAQKKTETCKNGEDKVRFHVTYTKFNSPDPSEQLPGAVKATDVIPVSHRERPNPVMGSPTVGYSRFANIRNPVPLVNRCDDADNPAPRRSLNPRHRASWSARGNRRHGFTGTCHAALWPSQVPQLTLFSGVWKKQFLARVPWRCVGAGRAGKKSAVARFSNNAGRSFQSVG